MRKPCVFNVLDRRAFLATSGLFGVAGLLPSVLAEEAPAALALKAPRPPKQPARVLAAFLYPPADVVNAGQNEDSWRVHNWFTWPGNQFEPEQQENKFKAKISEMAERLGITVEYAPQAIYQQAKVDEFIAQAKASQPDAVLIVNFWNTFSKWSLQMATESAPTAIVYHSVGSNHQLPPESLRTAEGLYYIHSIENWAEIERGLLAVRAKKMLAQSRLLRVSGRVTAPAQDREPRLDVDIVGIPAEEFNSLFDSIEPDDAIVRQAMDFKRGAAGIREVSDEYFVDAMRAHRAVGQIMERYSADALTIECLFLKHRKPCVSFALNNGQLVPCACENDLNASLTQMLGRWLLERGGFQHNPEFDTSENRYFGAHCTCAWKMHGPEGPAKPYHVRPFFHQLPKTAALDVQFAANEPAMVLKYLTGQDTINCWAGTVIESPTSPPTGGCATRVLMDIPGVTDVCEIYAGPHPVLFCGDRGDARKIKAFSRMYRLALRGNV